MYQDHVAILNSAMRRDPDIFLRGVTFAVLSIRQKFPLVCDQLAEVDVASTKARALWGYKRGAYDFLRSHKIDLHHNVVNAKRSEDAIEALCTIPGLGIVKSAFVAQMMGHDIGCLDSRNVHRLGLNFREWRTDGRKTTMAFKRKVGRYVDYTNGKAEALWNDWCVDAASAYSVTADDISKRHLCIVPLSYRRGLSLDPVPMVSRIEIPFDVAA